MGVLSWWEARKKRKAWERSFQGTAATEKPTGLERLSDEELDGLLAPRSFMEGGPRAFRPGWSDACRTTTWSWMFRRPFLAHPAAGRFRKLLASRLAGRGLLELGIGEQFFEHQLTATELLGVDEFRAVDRENPLYAMGLDGGPDFSYEEAIEVGDLWAALRKRADGSASVSAFGVFNEPLDAGGFLAPAESVGWAQAGHIEHEYLRRLARELARVVPKDGLLFGAGLCPLSGQKRDLATYLGREGFVADESYLDALVEAVRGRAPYAGWVAYPFFLVKAGSGE